MYLTKTKKEFYDFTDKLYNNLEENLKQCSTVVEVNELLEEEYTNIRDYINLLKSNAIGSMKEELENKGYAGDTAKKSIEIQNKAKDIHVTHIKIDENKIYVKEGNESITYEEESNKNNKTKVIMAIVGVIVGAVVGFIVKREILDAIILGMLGAAAGAFVYEGTLGKNQGNDKIEKIIKKDRQVNKRLNKDYFHKIVNDRKLQLQEIFSQYIDNFEDLLNKEI